MLKKANLRLTAVVILAVLTFTGSVFAGTYSGGTGEPNDPFLIADVNDLLEMRDEPNDWDSHFLLINDIDLNGIVFTTAVISPDIDNYQYSYEGTAFTGIFDGNNNEIISLTIDANGINNEYLGLFGQIKPNGQIMNLGLEDVNVNINGDNWSTYLGGLCGNNLGIINNCYVSGSIISREWSQVIGGLCGMNEGSILNCDVISSVIDVNISFVIGGLCGDNRGSISNCGTTVDISSGYSRFLGALCGLNKSTISNCYTAGNIIGGHTLGGLCSSNTGTIISCYATGSVSSERGSYLGGLCGASIGTISNCYATGSVTGGYFSRYIGGLVGFNGIIKARPGGSEITTKIAAISNCYSTGHVTGGGHPRYPVGGGLVGAMGYSAFVTNSFWDVNTSGLDISAGGVVLTTTEMQTMSSFTDAGWDFVGETINGTEDIWKICEGVDYPKLWWEMIDSPVINEEPQLTLGNSNTITWQDVNEAIEYYVLCCSDPYLDNLIAESGWIDANEYTFDGLETGYEYYYAVKARKNCVLESYFSDVVSSLQTTLADAVDMLLDPNSLKNTNMANALINKIDQVQAMIDSGKYKAALAKLENDILTKTDGCANDGQPDNNDWITTCTQQEQIYQLIIEAIEYAQSIIE